MAKENTNMENHNIILGDLTEEARVLLGNYFDLALDIDHEEATIKSETLSKSKLVTVVNTDCYLATMSKRIDLKNIRKQLLAYNIIIL